MGDYEFIVVKNILEDFMTYYDSIDTSSITKYYLDMILGFENHVLTFHLKLIEGNSNHRHFHYNNILIIAIS